MFIKIPVEISLKAKPGRPRPAVTYLQILASQIFVQVRGKRFGNIHGLPLDGGKITGDATVASAQLTNPSLESGVGYITSRNA